jgi:hypothetical protein
MRRGRKRRRKIPSRDDVIAWHYGSIQLAEQELTNVRAFLGEELTNLRLDTERERRIQERRLVGIEADRKKLLYAHYPTTPTPSRSTCSAPSKSA